MNIDNRVNRQTERGKKMYNEVEWKKKYGNWKKNMNRKNTEQRDEKQI